MACSLLSLTLSLVYYTDFLTQLLKSRKKKASAFKAGKNKAKINDFEISDDESKRGRMKRVTFLKTQRISSPPEDSAASESHENEPPDSSVSHHNDYNNSFCSQQSTNVSEDDAQFQNGDGESTDPQIARESKSKSLSYQTLEDTLLDTSLPLLSDNSVMEPPGPEEKSSQTPQLSATDLKHVSSAGLFTLFHVQVTKGTFHVIYQLLLFR